MIIRKLDFLKPTHDLPMFNFDVYNNKAIGIVYFEDKGYVLFEKDNTELNNVFFIKTNTLPAQYLVDNPAPSLANDKENIIGIISLILDDIYDDDIKEYDKKHPEFVFLRLFDNLSNGNVELISKDNELYDLIDDGFIRLELSNLKSMTN